MLPDEPQKERLVSQDELLSERCVETGKHDDDAYSKDNKSDSTIYRQSN